MHQSEGSNTLVSFPAHNPQIAFQRRVPGFFPLTYVSSLFAVVLSLFFFHHSSSRGESVNIPLVTFLGWQNKRAPYWSMGPVLSDC